MKTKFSGLLKASAVAISLIGSTAIVATFTFPDIAYAKEGKGGGNGGGKGGGKGGGNDGGKGGGKGNDSAGKGNKGAGKGQDAKGKVTSKGGSKKSAGKTGGRKSASGSGKSNTSKSSNFSLKDLFTGKKSSDRTEKPKRKSQRVARSTESTVQVAKSVRPLSRKKDESWAEILGAHPSELGALNAAHASETALKNAAPNSRVGRIATYRDTVLEGDELRDDLQDAQDLLDGLEPPSRPIGEIEDDLEAAEADVRADEERVAELEQELADAGGTDPHIEAQLDEANAELQESRDTAAELAAEQEAASNYDDAVSEVEDLQDQLEDQTLREREALENAANKPVTDEVEAAVKALLGL